MYSSEKRFPILVVRGITVFPQTVVSFDVVRERSVAAVKDAIKGDRFIFVSSQKDIKIDNPTPSDIFEVGCLSVIQQVIKAPGNVLRITVRGISRGRISEVFHSDEFYSAAIDDIKPDVTQENASATECEAHIRLAQEAFDTYADIIERVPPEVIITVLDAKDPGYLADYIANNCNFRIEDKQLILETAQPLERLRLVIKMLYRENEILSMESEIHQRVQESMEHNQKEYYIREQIRELNAQLGAVDDPRSEADEYREKIETLKIPEESVEKLIKEVDKFSKMPSGSHDAAAIRTYLDTVLSIPWNIETKSRTDVRKAAKVLDKHHYGLGKIKERILEFIAARSMSPDINGQIICLVGPPGTGKSSIASSIAEALNRKFVRISLGGVKDESEIRGHRKTYIAAMPGRIVNAICQAKSMNPLILLDEVDKLSNDFRGDPSSALLEVLDPEQNQAFRDNYVEIPVDLSKVIFVATANNPDTIPDPLKDRMEIIELSSYTFDEKMHIAKEHLISKELKKHGLTRRQVVIEDSAIRLLINGYTREAGVRELERQIASLCRKTAKKIALGDVKSIRFTGENLHDYLGPEKYIDDTVLRGNNVGIANGLAWTAVGGEILQVEVNVMPGDGKLELTGSLGDVMKESVHAAASYIRANCKFFGIQPDFYKQNDIHVHVPDGATPKDGPSAGITIATAIISALTGKKVRGNIAMTGEITIRGRVLPIGGLKEKSMAAYKHGIDTVIIPAANVHDLYDVDDTVKKTVTFLPVTEYVQVAEAALEPDVIPDTCDFFPDDKPNKLDAVRDVCEIPRSTVALR